MAAGDVVRVEQALSALATLLAMARMRFPCPAGRPVLGAADEARLVHAVSLLQRRHDDAALELLGGWMQPAAVRFSLPAAAGIGHALASAGHRLALREWRFAELHGHCSWHDEPRDSGQVFH